ncbi:uncharacterized protein LY89DRAFT_732109 [Mollisia scopiformis]|uniref:Uncharacterized protein n=1 Tax=Mollisia scopiformis TaxID=149040 RepID=A0A194XED4_MOLSC|nr:uncharacterized protein LY89DRAFT_732109 [Mollisia scopiformis]KUJ18550.1 hypothetical protein LY89DRAFT_732109 [Mollisia scopiformis]
MSPTSIASPILFEYRKLWLISVLVFFLSTGVFVAQYPEEMKTYGPFTLAFATFLGFAAYSSARTPLMDLVPWLPMIVWLFVLLTVYFLPRLRELFAQPLDPEDAMEQGRHHPVHRIPLDDVRIQPNVNRPGNDPMELEEWLRGMDRNSVPGLPDDLSTQGSDIELPQHSEAMAVAWRRAVRMGRQGLMTGGLSQTSSDTPYPHNLNVDVHGGHFQNSDDRFNSPSLSPAASSLPSIGAESDTPLLG